MLTAQVPQTILDRLQTPKSSPCARLDLAWSNACLLHIAKVVDPVLLAKHHKGAPNNDKKSGEISHGAHWTYTVCRCTWRFIYAGMRVYSDDDEEKASSISERLLWRRVALFAAATLIVASKPSLLYAWNQISPVIFSQTWSPRDPCSVWGLVLDYLIITSSAISIHGLTLTKVHSTVWTKKNKRRVHMISVQQACKSSWWYSFPV